MRKIRKHRLTKRGRIVVFAAALILTAVFIRCCCGIRKGRYIGEFDMSHYCLEQWDGYHICGNSAYGCKGDKLVPGESIAVPKYLLETCPVGTKVVAVYPDGHEDLLTVHDTGQALSRLGRLDMPVKTHTEAMRLGVIKGVRLYEAK